MKARGNSYPNEQTFPPKKSKHGTLLGLDSYFGNVPDYCGQIMVKLQKTDPAPFLSHPRQFTGSIRAVNSNRLEPAGP